MNTPLGDRLLVSGLLYWKEQSTPAPAEPGGREPTTLGFQNLEIAMKTTLFALLFLLTSAAFGQAAGVSVSAEPQPVQIPSHQLYATQHFMQKGQTLLIVANDPYADTRGERPLWEVGAKPSAETPLGDVARLLKTQHAIAKKAVKVLEK